MTRDDAHACLEEIAEAIHELFPDSPRRAQFDHHVSTVAMVVDHLFDEAERTTDQ